MNARTASAVEGGLVGLGTRLRDLRRRQGFAIAELSAVSGVPVSTISKIENGRMAPSLVHAINLAAALDANLGFLMDRKSGSSSKFSALGASDRPRLDFPEMGLTLEDLNDGGFPRDVLEARLGQISPGARSGTEEMVHPGEELCFVFTGRLDYRIHGERYALAAGDTLQFEASIPHLWENPGAQTAHVLWVFSEAPSF